MTLQEMINQLFTEYENGHITMIERNYKIITLVTGTMIESQDELWEEARKRYTQ